MRAAVAIVFAVGASFMATTAVHAAEPAEVATVGERKITRAGRPERGGGAKAPVTIIEFSDYQCPFCKRAESVVDEVVKTYGDKIRVVFRDYPLPMHPQARPAAEAASCANAQGKFWDYHA